MGINVLNGRSQRVKILNTMNLVPFEMSKLKFRELKSQDLNIPASMPNGLKYALQSVCVFFYAQRMSLQKNKLLLML